MKKNTFHNFRKTQVQWDLRPARTMLSLSDLSWSCSPCASVISHQRNTSQPKVDLVSKVDSSCANRSIAGLEETKQYFCTYGLGNICKFKCLWKFSLARWRHSYVLFRIAMKCCFVWVGGYIFSALSRSHFDVTLLAFLPDYTFLRAGIQGEEGKSSSVERVFIPAYWTMPRVKQRSLAHPL